MGFLTVLWRRLGFLLLVVFGVSIITFAISHMIPGDPARLLAGERASEAMVAGMRQSLGLDRPPPEEDRNYILRPGAGGWVVGGGGGGGGGVGAAAAGAVPDLHARPGAWRPGNLDPHGPSRGRGYPRVFPGDAGTGDR